MSACPHPIVEEEPWLLGVVRGGFFGRNEIRQGRGVPRHARYLSTSGQEGTSRAIALISARMLCASRQMSSSRLVKSLCGRCRVGPRPDLLCKSGTLDKPETSHSSWRVSQVAGPGSGIAAPYKRLL